MERERMLGSVAPATLYKKAEAGKDPGLWKKAKAG